MLPDQTSQPRTTPGQRGRPISESGWIKATGNNRGATKYSTHSKIARLFRISHHEVHRPSSKPPVTSCHRPFRETHLHLFHSHVMLLVASSQSAAFSPQASIRKRSSPPPATNSVVHSKRMHFIWALWLRERIQKTGGTRARPPALVVIPVAGRLNYVHLHRVAS